MLCSRSFSPHTSAPVRATHPCGCASFPPCVSCVHVVLWVQEGGRSIIEEIMKAYADDEDIIRHGKSAILSMSALENLSKSAAIAAQAKARKVVAEEAPKDVLAEYRCVYA
jgi:hypothetical protein